MLYYLLAYTFMNIGAFAVVVWLQDRGRGLDLNDFRGLAGQSPLAAVTMTIFLLSLTGLPPLVGFYANHAVFPNDHIALYRLEQWRPCASSSANEIAERGFFALDALPEGVTRGTRRRIAELFDGAPLQADW